MSCAIEADFEKRKFILRVQDKVVELSKAVVEMWTVAFPDKIIQDTDSVLNTYSLVQEGGRSWPFFFTPKYSKFKNKFMSEEYPQLASEYLGDSYYSLKS